MPNHDTNGTTPTLEEWMVQLAAELGLPADFEVELDVVLDLARDAAHGIERPAAPLTTFLVGFVAGSRGGSTEEVRRLAGVASRLAIEHGAARNSE